MGLQLESPYQFPERLLLFGGGGAGKTTAALEIARATVGVSGTMHVLDNDESYAYSRALETDFTDIADRVRVTECAPDWESMCAAVAEVTAKADRSAGDWVVVDSISPAWDFVQAFTTEAIVGDDVSRHMMQVRRDTENLSAFHAQLMDTVPWNIVKKEYAKHITIPLRKWGGNLILTAEAKKLSKKELEDTQLRDWFSRIGVRPSGEGRLPHVTSTVMHLENAKTGWKMTTVKDRNRQKVEHEAFENFAIDYLMNVAGWKRVRKAAADG